MQMSSHCELSNPFTSIGNEERRLRRVGLGFSWGLEIFISRMYLYFIFVICLLSLVVGWLLHSFLHVLWGFVFIFNFSQYRTCT